MNTNIYREIQICISVPLRIYYGQLKQMVNSSKKSGAGTDEIFQPEWPFYGDMDSFLKDFVSPRPTESKLEKLSRTDTYHLKKLVQRNSTTIEEDDIQLRRHVMVKALNKLDNLNRNKESSIRKDSPDELFGKLIGQSIAEIQDGYKKELLKVQIQQIILQTTFSASQPCNPNNTSITASVNLMSPSFPKSFVPFRRPPGNVSNNGQSMNRTHSPFRQYESF